MNLLKVNFEKSRCDQSAYLSRAEHFFIIANRLNIFKNSQELEKAKEIVVNYRQGKVNGDLIEDQLWKAKQIYDSAFHPETGKKMILFARMSFQVPGNMFITGGMLQFYKTWSGDLFWQWINQTFNAVVNFTNRSGDSQISNSRLPTSGAVSTALLINKQVANLPLLVGHLVPFVAVVTANCVNIPFMRSYEISTSISVTDENGNHLGNSSKAESSRIFMAILPIFINLSLEVKILNVTPRPDARCPSLACRSHKIAAPALAPSVCNRKSTEIYSENKIFRMLLLIFKKCVIMF